MISIIIPTYNRINSLERSIRSVQKQTHDNWELVIIDDGSTDDTRLKIQPYLENRRIHYYYQSNQGVGAARNLGIKKANGNYIIFLDSDDYINNTLILNLYQQDYHKFDFINWDVNHINITNNQNSTVRPRNLGPLYNYKSLLFLAGSFCVKKQLLIEVGGYDTKFKYGENYELGIRLCQLQSLKTLYIPQTLAVFFVNENRQSSTTQNKLNTNLVLLNKHIDVYNRFSKEKSAQLYRTAFLYHSLGDYKSAKNYYLKSIRTDWMNYKAWFRLIQVNLNLK